MSYTAPQYVDTKEQAILALASTIKGEAVTGGDGSVNRALDILADVLAEQDVQVPQTDAGAILALAQYASGMVKPEGTIAITENGEGIDVAQYATADVSVSGGGGSSDLTTAHVTVMAGTVSETFEADAFNVCTFLETEGTAASVTAPIMGDDPVESLEFDAILYKGAAALSTYLPVASTSGGITDYGDGHFFVTGDCTITLS